ncbi:MAG: deoxycytidine deaminase [Spirirestis rafaelensis WJT71-NPBG6]|nr:deoxycytidine deaminase [Spirirestis rafaelensis WJT71-NPBG6]
MFSDEDINKAMIDFRKNQEEGIDIEPFDKKSLTPVGYDIRVGTEGFSWKRKCVVDIEKDGKIIIEPNDIVIIKTLEFFILSNKISATIHSIVSKVINKGLSNISTTIDPGYSGKLLISFCNYRDSSTEFLFKERLCTVCFYRVELPAKKNRGTPDDRDDLWEQLLEKAKVERERIEREERQKKQKIEAENSTRSKLLIFFLIIASIGGIGASLINPTVGSSVAAFLAVIVPIVYDKFLKSQSK